MFYQGDTEKYHDGLRKEAMSMVTKTIEKVRNRTSSNF